jgi:hypothetical protein
MVETITGALDRCLSAYKTLKQRSQAFKADINNGGASALALITFHDQIVNTWAQNISVLDGREDLNDLAAAHLIAPPADFQAQFAAVKAAGAALVSYIETMPASGGWLLVVQFAGTPSQQNWRTFSAAQLSSLDGLLDDLIAAIG